MVQPQRAMNIFINLFTAQSDLPINDYDLHRNCPCPPLHERGCSSIVRIVASRTNSTATYLHTRKFRQNDTP